MNATREDAPPGERYAARRDRYLAERSAIATSARRISWARLGVAIAGIVWIVVAERAPGASRLVVPGVVALALGFIGLVRIAGRQRERIRRLRFQELSVCATASFMNTRASSMRRSSRLQPNAFQS